MSITFNGDDKLIEITAPTLEVSAIELHSRAMDWAFENMEYHEPTAAYGKVSLGGGVYTDAIIELVHGWHIRWWGGDMKQVVITGTLIPQTDGDGLYLDQPEGAPVVLQVRTATAGTIMEGGGSFIWTTTQRDLVLSILRALGQGRAVLDNETKQAIIYDPLTGEEIARFNTFNVNGEPSITDVTERVPV